MTTLQLIPHLAPVVRTASTITAVGGEVLTAGALLAALNVSATAIEKTYAAGRFTRRVVDKTLIPAADAISWAASKVDWVEAARTVWACSLTIGVAFYVAGERTAQAFHAWHTEHVGSIDWSLPAEEPEIEDPRDTIAIEAPVAEVLDVTFDGGTHDLDWDAYVDAHAEIDALNALKVVELRRKAKGLAKGVHMMRKAELVALLVA